MSQAAPRLHLALSALLSALLASAPSSSRAEIPAPTRDAGFRLVDLEVGESAEVDLADGSRTRVEVLALDEIRDRVRAAIREARVKVSVDGEEVELSSSHYHLPLTVGKVRIDCPVTIGHLEGVDGNPWGIEKAVRLRLWPAEAPLTEPGTFGYPLRQAWFASATSMANEPIDAGVKSGYVYHYDLDFGGAEKLTEVVSATDGLVVSSANQTLPGYEDTPVRQRYDVVYLLDDRGFYYRYSHFHQIDPEVRIGKRVKIGQRLGILGKEGASGGWAHLHFGLWTRMPSGQWGSLDVYPLVWEAYLRDREPALLAVARPHHLLLAGETALLDGSKSWSSGGEIAGHRWTFGDGTEAEGAKVERAYPKPGRYSEILRVEDGRGGVSYDFARVLVVDPADPDAFPPNVHAAFSPTEGLRAGEAVTILVRSFRTAEGRERIDFGDGSEPVFVQSASDTGNLDPKGYASVEHRYERPGDYLVRIDRENERGWPAFTHLHIRVLP
jgi:murein DD-endopeptidase MepM/ murein hydrolase activator NlpD